MFLRPSDSEPLQSASGDQTPPTGSESQDNGYFAALGTPQGGFPGTSPSAFASPYAPRYDPTATNGMENISAPLQSGTYQGGEVLPQFGTVPSQEYYPQVWQSTEPLNDTKLSPISSISSDTKLSPISSLSNDTKLSPISPASSDSSEYQPQDGKTTGKKRGRPLKSKSVVDTSKKAANKSDDATKKQKTAGASEPFDSKALPDENALSNMSRSEFEERYWNRRSEFTTADQLRLKSIRRRISNRESASDSRQRRKNHVDQLEKEKEELLGTIKLLREEKQALEVHARGLYIEAKQQGAIFSPEREREHASLGLQGDIAFPEELQIAPVSHSGVFSLGSTILVVFALCVLCTVCLYSVHVPGDGAHPPFTPSNSTSSAPSSKFSDFMCMAVNLTNQKPREILGDVVTSSDESTGLVPVAPPPSSTMLVVLLKDQKEVATIVPHCSEVPYVITKNFQICKENELQQDKKLGLMLISDNGYIDIETKIVNITTGTF